MPDRRRPMNPRVLPILRSVRARWRLGLVLRGTAVVLGTAFAAFLLSAYGLEATRFSPGAVTALRLGAWGVALAAAGWFLVRPLLRRVTDDQVALYLEEHEPSLEAAILGAVGVERNGASAAPSASPELLDRLVERAVEKARAVDYGRAIDRRGLQWGSGSLSFVVLAVLLFLLLGPSHLRYGMTALVLPTRGAAEVSPYSISVLPGDVTLARGADQLITAELRGFDSDLVSLFVRGAEEDGHQRLSMLPADSGRFDLLVLNLVESTEYFVEADGVRSPTYTIEVADLPYVGEMTHTYVFPSYTGLDPREVEDAGDIAALAGTRVDLAIVPTIPTPGGRLLVNNSLAMELAPGPDGTLLGEIVVGRDGVYRIELAREDGRMVEASPEFTIDLLPDLPPSVAISRPGRDAAASAVEELYVEARADDDYGVRDLRLVYSVNGGAEDTVSLFRGGAEPLGEVSAGHTLFLEEWELDPGDVVAYYAVARDNRAGEAREALSDIYFVNIRPFRRDFRQAEQNQPPGEQAQGEGQQGQQGQGNNSLSELQKEVVAATFNLLRDRELYSPEEFRENVVSVALAQGRVREEVANLLTQMTTRGVAASDPRFQEIAELLPVAIADMESAEALLREERPREALPPEQRALTVLQKAEETYERTVGQQQGNPGGGGGGGGGASAEELADLFELELDKLQNQYETVQQGERQQADQEVDELMERLKELARRQQQELERQRSRTEAQQGGAGGSAGDAQRSLADETEEAARRLEELSRQTGDQQLAQTARRLQDAARSMRQSAASSGQSRGLADATTALDDLEEAQRRLERNREGRVEEGIQDALDRVDRLARSQEEVKEGVGRLPENPGDRGDEVQRLQERKDEMVRETQALESDLVRMQQGAQRESRETAGELGEAVEVIREGKLKEKLAYSKGMVEQRDREVALDFEEQIAEDIEALRQAVGEAMGAYQGTQAGGEMADALEQARELVRGTESLDRRLQNRGDQQGEEGQQGGQDPRGQQGQQGQQAQQGQPGQQGARPGQPGNRPGQPGDSTARGAGQGGGRAGDSLGAREREARMQGGPQGGATRGDPEPFTEEEIRQFTREFAQRLAQARELRETLEAEGRDTRELEEAIQALEELVAPESYGDLPQVAFLQEQIRESLKRVEFVLRREVEGERPGQAALTGSDEVPPGFRRMVEEYFRNLARRGGGGG